MSGRNTAAIGIVVAILVIGAVVSIGYYQFVVAPNVKTTTSTTSTSQAACTPKTCVYVSMVSGASVTTTDPGFHPTTITLVIGVNNTVIWTNNDTAIHTATANDKSFDTTNVAAGAASVAITFRVAGTYSYFCIYHAWMKGTVIVKPA